MSLTIVDRTDTFEAWRTKTNTISTRVGDIVLLDAGITVDRQGAPARGAHQGRPDDRAVPAGATHP